MAQGSALNPLGPCSVGARGGGFTTLVQKGRASCDLTLAAEPVMNKWLPGTVPGLD